MYIQTDGRADTLTIRETLDRQTLFYCFITFFYDNWIIKMLRTKEKRKISKNMHIIANNAGAWSTF